MRPLVVARLPEYMEVVVPVSATSTIRVKSCAYSVPSRLIGERVRVRIFEHRIEVYYANKLELGCERLRGRGVRIDYRHVIWSLVRKPGAFARYVYRDELFPTVTFRRAYDAIQAAQPGIKGDVEYLRILHLAASTIEADVEASARGAARRRRGRSRPTRRRRGAHEQRLTPLRPCLRSRRQPWISPSTTRSSRRWRHDAPSPSPLASPAPSTRSSCCCVRSSCRRSHGTPRRSPAKPTREGWTFGQYLHHLAELEVEERRVRRIDRALRDSDLPAEKTLATLNRAVLPPKVAKQLAASVRGRLRRARRESPRLRAAGPRQDPRRRAIGHELIRRGYRVLFTPTFALVQRLLAAKRDLRLERELEALDIYHAVILDDIGYVQQSRDEMEVLFTFLAERYERKSVLITSNLVFSDWIRIFKDPMTTAAAIDRLIHHAVIIEMTGPSIRNNEALKRGDATPATTTTTTNQPATTIPEANGAM